MKEFIPSEPVRIPSPQEIESRRTGNGGWTRYDLQEWGIQWPPREGWKDELEKAYRDGFTVGMVLECIGCRRMKFFVEYNDCPLCKDCQTAERIKYEKEHSDRAFAYDPIRQNGRSKKEPIPPDIRWAVWERDNFTCKHCGSRKNLTIDHIVPESKGGKMTMENAQTLCKSCNSRKGAR